MRNIYRIGLPVFCALAFAAAGCNNTTVTTNGNGIANRPANTNSSNANLSNANTGTNITSAVVDTREPEAYQATVSLKLETMSDQQKPNLPPITAQVARNGADRRMEFSLPNGEKLIYLDTGGKHLLISPNRKQFAELSKEAVGFELRKMMTPDQIVRQVQNLKGLERIGEETFNGRPAVKYRYGAVTDTKSQAGQVQTESIVLVDKETSLPLRSEIVSESQGGQVQGIKGLRIFTEMSNIQTTAPPELFKAPTDYKQVAPEEVRAQVEVLTKLGAALLGQMMQNAQPGVSPAISPIASPATTPNK